MGGHSASMALERNEDRFLVGNGGKNPSMIRLNEFQRNKLHVSSIMIVTQKMFRAISLFHNRFLEVKLGTISFTWSAGNMTKLVEILFALFYEVTPG